MSTIEWTEKTWNPTTGCDKLTKGCDHCYAEVMSRRLKAMGTPGYENGFQFAIHPNRLSTPLKIKKPTTWFVNSMSDLFHAKCPYSFIDKVFDVIRQTPQHTYQILTKRPFNMERYFRTRIVPENAWLGTSVENIKEGLPRLKHLSKINAQTKFLSCEPLLEDLGLIDLSDIHWVIVGGESGHGARPMHSAWVENIKVQCTEQNVPFFFKQWGAFGEDGLKRNKKVNGRKLSEIIWNEYPLAIT